MNSWVLLWGFVIVAMGIFEAATSALVSIWFVAGGVVALVLALFNVNYIIQVVVFALVSLLSMIVVRKYAVNRMLKGGTKDVNDMAGKEGIVKEEIDNILGTGLIVISGVTWTAKSDDNTKIAVGEHVIVERVEGVKAIVKLLKIERNEVK